VVVYCLCMRVATPKKSGVALLSLIFSISILSTVFADQRPYFKTFGADVFSGGWFTNNGQCDTTVGSNYQDPLASGGASTTGGIQAYANTDASGNNVAGGSSSQFASFALGVIEGNKPTSYGFYSSGVSAGANHNALTFADTPNWGGQFQGSVRDAYCIPDYYGKKPASAAAIGSLNAATLSTAYAVTAVGAPFALTGTGGGADVPIAAGKNITIYVDGNAYIDRNIVYQLDTANNVPKFALVVRGSIYIDPAVTQLDGLYIAQVNASLPSPVNSDNGDIWTCHPDDANQLLYTYPTANCRNKLTLKNGAFIAKQINLMRVNGDVASATTAEDARGTAYGSANIGEVINYSPAMVIGGPFFSPVASGSSSQLKTDSIISLPPIF
jgi:hypothetical protein